MTDFKTVSWTALKAVRKYEDEFLKLDNTQDKLIFIFDKLTESAVGIDSAVKKWKKLPGIQTDSIKAKEFREKGNAFYKNKQMEKAAQSYRKALNLLPGNAWANQEDREEFALALGNLSAVSFETNKFFESRICVEVVLACAKNNLNQERRKKFLKRSKQCLKNIKAMGIIEKENVKFPKYKMESFTIVHKDLVGRNGVAVEDIQFGEVILIEDPVGSRCKIDKGIRQCENCNQCLHQTQPQQIISSPFDKDALFCSLSCLITAVETYHFYESKINFWKAFPKDDLGSNMSLLPLRLISQKPPHFFSSSSSSGRDYGCGLQLEDISAPADYGCGLQLEDISAPADYGCGLQLKDISAYPCLDSMVTHMEDQGCLGQMEMAVTAVILLHCLVAMEYLDHPHQLDGLSLHITTLLYQYQAKVRCNAYQIDWNYSEPGQDFCGTHLLTVGTGVYPILCLLNHSCDANTARFNIGNRVLLVASRNIRKGEEVTSSYGETFLESNKKTRQNIFESKYHFLCQCAACDNDYPTYADLPSDVPLQIFDVINLGFQNLESALNNAEYTAAIEGIIDLYNRTSTVPELHKARQRMRVFLGTCYKMAFSLQVL